ncbi:hypothetical protein CROQUDRAFT_91397 [Cronartium quercuum f. sp. fusiforme G11]|uniref:Uncharacterized protein n=1 Tax=Cronartium quercuum f. sp. fusiforme G11 TaxID=708437 RepID=A0A9P6NK80_9BASI|nr:hypothetical protein CROQUDRAFT_91397 [Cronartium quercuum f. sp. fusiforme G11]
MLVPRAPDMSDPLSNWYQFLGLLAEAAAALSLAQTTESRYLSAVNSFFKVPYALRFCLHPNRKNAS